MKRGHAKHSAEELKAYEAAGVGAYIAVPLVREGRIAAYLAVNDVNPRTWTLPEVALAEETAQRIWAEVERARAKATAHEAEGRYLALYNAIDQGFCTIEVSFDEQQRATDYRFLEVSPSFERQTGIVDGAGRWMRDIAPDHDEHWFDIYGKVALTGESIRFENYSTPLNRWWSVYAFKIEGDAKIAVLFHDITDRKRAEVALRTSKQQFETLLNQAPLGVYLVDSDFVIRQVNPIAAPVFGEMEEGPIGRDFDEVIHILWDKDYADEVVRIFRQTLETGEPYVTAERAEHRNDRDTIEYYEWRLDRIILQDGRYGVVCYFRDISAQVHARLEIERGRELAREKEERLRLIVKNARDYAILTIDLNGIVTDWYEGAEAVFGWSRDEIVGKDSGILYTPKDREDRVPQAERDSAAEMGKAADVRWHVCKNGKAVLIEGVVTALPDANGEVSGFLKIGQDITDRKRSEEHQKLLLAELQHRVRNILAMIKSVVRRTFDTSESCSPFTTQLCSG